MDLETELNEITKPVEGSLILTLLQEEQPKTQQPLVWSDHAASLLPE